MAQSRETLSKYFPKGGLTNLGFRSGPEASGYIMPGSTLMPYYHGEVVRQEAPDQDPIIRRFVVITDGRDWFVGARIGLVATSGMLEDMVTHGIQNGSADKYRVRGRDLPELLQRPEDLPTIETHQTERPAYLGGFRAHSFE